jgi:hypothetical protein
MNDTTKNAVMSLEEYKNSLLRSIAIAIQATNCEDKYSVGLRNGLRVCKAYIDGLEPEYEECKPSVEPEKETAKRVIWTGWKGCRDTRYKCPNCKKPVKNDDVYCHRCGQKLMFPHISWTDYVEGQKQELIVRWDDDQSELQPDTEPGA